MPGWYDLEKELKPEEKQHMEDLQQMYSYGVIVGLILGLFLGGIGGWALALYLAQ